MHTSPRFDERDDCMFACVIMLIIGGVLFANAFGTFPESSTGFSPNILFGILGACYLISALVGMICRNKEVSKGSASFLSVVFGIFGADRMCYHYFWWGLFKGFTLGGAFIWWIIDMIGVCSGLIVSKEAKEERESAALRADMQAHPWKYSLTDSQAKAIGRSQGSTGTKTIIKDAVKGGMIAGPTGAVVGAIVGKNKVDNAKK